MRISKMQVVNRRLCGGGGCERGGWGIRCGRAQSCLATKWSKESAGGCETHTLLTTGLEQRSPASSVHLHSCTQSDLVVGNDFIRAVEVASVEAALWDVARPSGSNRRLPLRCLSTRLATSAVCHGGCALLGLRVLVVETLECKLALRGSCWPPASRITFSSLFQGVGVTA
jgi:hypothetical protein